MKEPTVVITGAGGFLGGYISRQFRKCGWTVYGLGRGSPENAPMQWLEEYFQGCLLELEALGWVTGKQPDAVIHCAGRASVPQSFLEPAEDYSSNTTVTCGLLEAIRKTSPQSRFVLLSSAAVYGNPRTLPITEADAIHPISPYGFHKQQAELLCKEYAEIHGIATCALRIFSAYGPGLRRQVLWDIMTKLAGTQREITLFGTGDETRDFVHARDVADAAVAVINSGPMEGESYNLGSGLETSIKDLVRILMESGNFNPSVRWDGINRPGNPLRWQADISNLGQLGFTPKKSIEVGAAEYAAWAIPFL